MARPFVFPDPKDRSINEPTTVANQAQVLGLFNQTQETANRRERVTEPVKEWFLKEASSLGWATAEFHGSQCVLGAKLSLEKE